MPQVRGLTRGSEGLRGCEHQAFGAPSSSALLGAARPTVPAPCPPLAAPHLNDSPTQPRHVCQLLKRLCVGVVVLSKLCLHNLGWGEERGGQDEAGEPQPLGAPPPAQPRYLQLLGGEGGAGPLGRLRLAVLLRGHSPLQRDPIAYKREKPRVPQVRNSACLPAGPACNGCSTRGQHAWHRSVGHPQHPLLQAVGERAAPALPLGSCPGLLSPSTCWEGDATGHEEFTVELRKNAASWWKLRGMRDGETAAGTWVSRRCVKESADVPLALTRCHCLATSSREQLRRGPCLCWAHRHPSLLPHTAPLQALPPSVISFAQSIWALCSFPWPQNLPAPLPPPPPGSRSSSRSSTIPTALACPCSEQQPH